MGTLLLFENLQTPEAPDPTSRWADGIRCFRDSNPRVRLAGRPHSYLEMATLTTWKIARIRQGFARLCAASCPCKHDIFNREENPLKCWNHFLPWPSPLMYSCPPARVTSSKVLPLLSGMQDMEDLVTHWAMRTFDPLVTLCVKCTHQSTMNTSLQATHICLELQWAHSSVEGHTWCCQVKRQCVQRFQATLTPVIMTAEADLRCFFSHHTAT